MKKMVAKGETTLLEFLAAAGYSKTKIKQLLKYRAIAIGDREVARYDHLLSPGDEVTVKSARDMDEEAQPCPGLPIVYEDEAVIVIDKPPGLLTIATAKEKEKTAYYMLNECLKERPAAVRERIFIVHRLDRDTSGLLVFAKSEAAKRILQDNWERVDKKYGAVVEGVPREKSGTIESYLYESKALRVYSVREGKEEARHAITRYQVVAAGEEYALVDITLETGRKNQIRVHMADIGHPVAGDRKYGAKTDPVGRLALHAYSLAFDHPTTGSRLELRSNMPRSFNKCVPKGRKGSAGDLVAT